MLRMLMIGTMLAITTPAWALDDSEVIEAVLADRKLPLTGHERDEGADLWTVRNTHATFARYADKRAWELSLDSQKEIPKNLLRRMKFVCRVHHDRELGAYEEIYKLEDGKYIGGLVRAVKHGNDPEAGFSIYIESPMWAILGRNRQGSPAIKLPDACAAHR